MAFCKNCGAEIEDKALICQSCGVAQENVTEESTLGYGILGCCVPIVGLILYITWKDNKPQSAKSAGIGALINCAILVICIMVSFAFLGSVFAGMGTY